jgi:hypothetical protein
MGQQIITEQESDGYACVPSKCVMCLSETGEPDRMLHDWGPLARCCVPLTARRTCVPHAASPLDAGVSRGGGEYHRSWFPTASWFSEMTEGICFYRRVFQLRALLHNAVIPPPMSNDTCNDHEHD